MSIHAYEYTKKQSSSWEAKRRAEYNRSKELQAQFAASKAQKAAMIEKEYEIFAEKMSLDQDFQSTSDMDAAVEKCKKYALWDRLSSQKKENAQFAARVIESGAICPNRLSKTLQTSPSIFLAYTKYYMNDIYCSENTDPEAVFSSFSFATSSQKDTQQVRKRVATTFLQEASFVTKRPKLLEGFLKELSDEERVKYKSLAMQILPINQAISLLGDTLLKDRKWVIERFTQKDRSENSTSEEIASTYQMLSKELQDDTEVAKAALKGNNRAIHVYPVLSSKQKNDKDIALFALSNDVKLTRQLKIEKLGPFFSKEVLSDDKVIDKIFEFSTSESDCEVLSCVFTCGITRCVRSCIDAKTQQKFLDQQEKNQDTYSQSQSNGLSSSLISYSKSAEMT